MPLAYLLDDACLKEKVHRYLGYILEHQDEDGWLGPREMVVHAGAVAEMRYDLWGQLLAARCWSSTTRPAAIRAPCQPLRAKPCACMDRIMDRTSLFNWGQFAGSRA